MKVIATIKFNDLESNKIREINDVFDVSKERAKVLLEKNYVREVVEKATIKSTKVKRNAKK